MSEDQSNYVNEASSPARTYAGVSGKTGIALGLGAGIASSLYHKHPVAKAVKATLGTGALWGTAGLLGGSFVKRNDDIKVASFVSPTLAKIAAENMYNEALTKLAYAEALYKEALSSDDTARASANGTAGAAWSVEAGTAAGGLAGVGVGTLVGRRIGGKTGLGIGAMVGEPIGATIGSAVGALNAARAGGGLNAYLESKRKKGQNPPLQVG